VTLTRLRRTVHTGSVLASGLAIGTRLTGEAEARKRILGLPVSGLRVFRLGSTLVVKFPAALRVNTKASLGAALVRYGRLLSAAPLAPDEQAALETAVEAAVLADGSIGEAVPLHEGVSEDISLWIDVSEFEIVEGLSPLGGAASEPEALLAPPAADVRLTFGVAPLDDKAAELLRALRERSMEGARGSAGVRRNGSWLAGALGSLWRLFQPPSTGHPGRAAPAPARAAPVPAGEKRASIAARLQRAIARAVWSTPLIRFLGGQYARYLSRLLAMFDENDLDNALRHAMPLNAEIQAGLARLPFWTPSPRASLSINPQRTGAKTALGLSGDFYKLLQERYRRAFEHLEAAGQIEKAAFVLAELLNANEEAVQFLERHKRLRLAAEIAEARNLPPGLVIRQWFLAGERERAIRIAQRTGAFADAVIRLEASSKEEAKQLRLLWANTLASGGLYAAAVDAVWPIEDARNLALAWIGRAIEAGGPSGARMLARKVRLAPQEFPDLLGRSLKLLEETDEESPFLMRIFAQELVTGGATDETRLIARSAARRFLAHGMGDEPLMQKLLDASGDAPFRADVRTLGPGTKPSHSPEAAPLSSRTVPVQIERSAADQGTGPIFDAAALPNGRMLVARGELGALLLAREGKIIARFAEPASAIVISDQGDRALLLARRGEIYRVSRLDLVTRQIEPWCDARFDVFARDFDGLTWFVGRGGTVYATDATARRWEHLWKVDEDGARVQEIRRDGSAMSVWLNWAQPRREIWSYDLPSLFLRRRQELESFEDQFESGTISPSGEFAELRAGPDGARARIWFSHGWQELPIHAPGRFARVHGLTRHWAVLSTGDRHDSTIHLLDCAGRKLRACIDLKGANCNAFARIQGERLLVYDDCGRLLLLSLKSGAVLQEHRLS
jgi:MoxR-vWA-beta-propeller ternary system domain bpX6